jgi:competence protein ComFB
MAVLGEVNGMIIKNFMEEIVFHSMDDVLKDINMCKCEICRMDIAAKALNDLPPQYVVTVKGEVYSKINNLKTQFEVDVISAITKAAVLVKRYPRHDQKLD